METVIIVAAWRRHVAFMTVIVMMIVIMIVMMIMLKVVELLAWRVYFNCRIVETLYVVLLFPFHASILKPNFNLTLGKT